MELSPQYLAGLIDGEGYLGILPVRSKEVKNPSFEPVIKIGMTGYISEHIFETISTKYGGIVERPKKRTTGNRIKFTYVLKGKKNVLNLVEDILPYLHIKLTQAVVMKEFCEIPMTHTNHRNFNQENVDKKITCYEILKILKQSD